MGPRSRDRGYRVLPGARVLRFLMLQWVHGHVTVVILETVNRYFAAEIASMGPRSRDRGYQRFIAQPILTWIGFNGSTVT